jgi:hypothetical protein
MESNFTEGLRGISLPVFGAGTAEPERCWELSLMASPSG